MLKTAVAVEAKLAMEQAYGDSVDRSYCCPVCGAKKDSPGVCISHKERVKDKKGVVEIGKTDLMDYPSKIFQGGAPGTGKKR